MRIISRICTSVYDADSKLCGKNGSFCIEMCDQVHAEVALGGDHDGAEVLGELVAQVRADRPP
jgi:hypothetical protein